MSMYPQKVCFQSIECLFSTTPAFLPHLDCDLDFDLDLDLVQLTTRQSPCCLTYPTTFLKNASVETETFGDSCGGQENLYSVHTK